MPNPLSVVRRRLLSAALLFSFGPAFVAASALQAAKPAAPKAAAAAKAAPVDDNSKLDLNSASIEQLAQLPGIGPAYSKRIVEGRPYTAKTQLTSRGIIPQKTYDGIKEQVIARKPAAK